MEKDVYTYDFNDWVNEMLNQSDYTELELLDFKEHYQNLLDAFEGKVYPYWKEEYLTIQY